MSPEERQQKLASAKAIVREGEERIAQVLYVKQYTEMPCMRSKAQGELAALRHQQRYLMLAYAFLRGRKYKRVERTCRQSPSVWSLQLAVAILTQEPVKSVGDAALAKWLADAGKRAKGAQRIPGVHMKKRTATMCKASLLLPWEHTLHACCEKESGHEGPHATSCLTPHKGEQQLEWTGETWWWLSFADHDGFRGAVCIRGDDFLRAVQAAHMFGINPGGQVAGAKVFPFVRVPDWARKKLLNKKECEQFDLEITQQLVALGAVPEEALKAAAAQLEQLQTP